MIASCRPWAAPGFAHLYLTPYFSIGSWIAWYLFLLVGYLYTSLVIVKIPNWYRLWRRPLGEVPSIIAGKRLELCFLQPLHFGAAAYTGRPP
jgi:hypothetical protein